MLFLNRDNQAFKLTAASGQHHTSSFKSVITGTETDIVFNFDIDIKNAVSMLGEANHNWGSHEDVLGISLAPAAHGGYYAVEEEGVLGEKFDWEALTKPGSVIIPVVLTLVSVFGGTTFHFEQSGYTKLVKVNTLSCTVSDDRVQELDLWKEFELLKTYRLTLHLLPEEQITV